MRVPGGMKMPSLSLGPGTVLGKGGEAPWVGPATFSVFRLYILAPMKAAVLAAPGLAPFPSFAANDEFQREQTQVKPRKKLLSQSPRFTHRRGDSRAEPGPGSSCPPRCRGTRGCSALAWSLAVPSRDTWVWRDIKSIIISDPAFLLINGEKVSGKGNCSSYIAVFWFAWFFGLGFFCSLHVPCRKNY